MRKIIVFFIFILVCYGIYHAHGHERNLYAGYSYNIRPQVNFLNEILSKDYNNEYKIYTALFNEDDDIPNIREYNPKAILWLGKGKFKLTKDLIANLKNYGIVLCSAYNRCETLEMLNINNTHQFPIFLVSEQFIHRSPQDYALLGNPVYATKTLKEKNLSYKKYTFKNLHKLKENLHKIKAIIIEETVEKDYDLDEIILLADFNNIPIITSKENFYSNYVSLLGIDAYYYLTKEMLNEIILNIEKKIKKHNRHNYVKKYLTKESASNHFRAILDNKELKTDYEDKIKINIAAKLGHVRSGDYWLVQDLVSNLSQKYKYLVEFENNDYKPVFPVNIFILGTFSVVNSKLKSKNNLLWLMYPSILDNIESIDEYIEKFITKIDKNDIVATASQKIKKKLEEKGLSVIYIPQFTNTDKFYRDYDADKKSEILFVGNNWFKRKIVYMAKENNLPLTLYGNSYPKNWAKSTWVDNRILRKYYSSAKIVLSDQQRTMKDMGFIVNRIFDVTACGTMVISEYVDEIERIYGECIPMYKTEDEFVRLVNYYLKHDAEREEKAKCAQRITLENYTAKNVSQKINQLIDQMVERSK